jgi:predicted transcriptional regulator of viral defense system
VLSRSAGCAATGESKRLGLLLTPDISYTLQVKAIMKSSAEVARLVRRLGLVRPLDLEKRGIPRRRLYELLRNGSIERTARGVYVARDHSLTAEHALAQASKRVPAGVICLLTALRFHDLTTQSPAEVWMALAERARKPSLGYPRLRIARFSGASLTEGVEWHRIEGVDVPIYSAAKTVADCFKFRHKIGIDVAVEALRDFRRRHRGGGNDLARFARICRVTRVMQPYLDALS